MTDSPAVAEPNTSTPMESLVPSGDPRDPPEVTEDQTPKRTRKHTKARCPFWIEKWIEDGDGGDPGDGYWMLLLDEEASALDSTTKAVAWAEKNCPGGDYRIIQERDKFTLKSENVKKVTIDRG